MFVDYKGMVRSYCLAFSFRGILYSMVYCWGYLFYVYGLGILVFSVLDCLVC